MKKLLFIVFAVISFAASAQSTKIISGYYKPSTGTFVNPYISTKSNSTNLDNFSTTGNANPYTVTSGTRAQDFTLAASNYGSVKQFKLVLVVVNTILIVTEIKPTFRSVINHNFEEVLNELPLLS